MEKKIEKLLLKARLVKINRICDLVQFMFELPNKSSINIHSQCFLRIFDSNDILIICSNNMYSRSPNFKKKLFKKYDWTEYGTTVFDDSINDNKCKLINAEITSVNYNKGDLELTFDNNMRLNLLVSVTKYDDIEYCENYRIFEVNQADDHIVI